MSDKNAPKLSPREEEVINLAAQGLTDNGIANRLEISSTTVNSYWVRIRSKLGSLSRTELVRDYLMAGAEEALNAVRQENERLQEQLHSLTHNGSHSITDSHSWNEVFQRSTDAVMIVATNGTIRLASPSACEMFGYEKDALLGMAVEDLIPLDMRAAHHLHRSDYVNQPSSRKMGGHLATPALRRDGTMFPLAVVLTPLDSVDEFYICCYLRNITLDLETARRQLSGFELQ